MRYLATVTSTEWVYTSLPKQGLASHRLQNFQHGHGDFLGLCLNDRGGPAQVTPQPQC